MEKELKKALRENETVLWKSRPAAFDLLDAENRSSIIRKWIITAAVVLAFCALYFSYNTIYNYKVVGFVLLIAFGVVFAPITNRFAISRQLYAITNQRVIVIAHDHALYYMEFADIDATRILYAKSGHHALALGSEILPKLEKQVRWQAAHPKTASQADNSREHAVGILLYSLPDVNVVLSLLPSQAQHPIEHPAA